MSSLCLGEPRLFVLDVTELLISRVAHTEEHLRRGISLCTSARQAILIFQEPPNSPFQRVLVCINLEDNYGESRTTPHIDTATHSI